jgi:membrane-bound metal-dependent hydrolase YbcI (DUF457 family)
MPNLKTHLVVGAATGAVLNILYQAGKSRRAATYRFDLLQFAACTGAGATVGALADVIEPATTPNHRAFFHSVTFGGVGTYACFGPHSDNWSQETKEGGRFLWLCYLSHLVADSTTPKGLPLLGLASAAA